MVSSLISSVRGTLDGLGPDWADILVGGVTFRVNIPTTVVDSIGQLGDSVRLFTSLQVREDSLNLYGFPTPDARKTFEILLGVNGIGPRVALSILSKFTPETLAGAVGSEDTKAFTGVSGVGNKTASRIVLELKGKLEGEWAVVPTTAPGDPDAIDALTSLGYTTAEAREALTSLPNGNSLTLEEKIRMALQQIAGSP